VYDPPMTFTIQSGSLVDNTGCPAKSSTKGDHRTVKALTAINTFAVLRLFHMFFCCNLGVNMLTSSCSYLSVAGSFCVW
jgi:hypothetical protein